MIFEQLPNLHFGPSNIGAYSIRRFLCRSRFRVGFCIV